MDKNFNKTFVFLFIGSLLTFAYIFMVSFMAIPKENERLVDTILGVLLGTILTGSFNYFTGTTLGSQKKDATIADAQNNVKDALASMPPGVTQSKVEITQTDTKPQEQA